MAIYNINIRTDSHIADSLEVEMADQTALRIEVARFVGEMLRDEADLIWEDKDWRIDVTDAEGKIIYVLHISAAEAGGSNDIDRRAHDVAG